MNLLKNDALEERGAELVPVARLAEVGGPPRRSTFASAAAPRILRRMEPPRRSIVARWLLGLGLLLSSGACAEGEPRTWAMRPIAHDYLFPHRSEAGEVVPEGISIGAIELDRGRMAYVDFCASCHGLDGDGQGPASAGLDPRPRDFRRAAFKFAAVRSGELPRDEDLHRLIREGLHGTTMPPWGLDDADIERISHFIKTFPPPGCAPDAPACAPEGPGASPWIAVHASGSRQGRPKRVIGAGVAVPPDPWRGRVAEAVKAGEAVYHVTAQCSTCHPAYLTTEELAARSRELGQGPPSSPRERPHESVPVAADQHPYGVALLPPDFTSSELRSIRRGREAEDLYRVIAAGVGGVMPSWVDALSPEQLFAVVHYVQSLIDLKRPERAGDRAALRRKLGLPVGP